MTKKTKKTEKKVEESPKKTTKKTEKTAPKKETTKKAATKKKEEDVPELTDEMIEEIQNEMGDLHENLKNVTRFNAAAKRARKNTTNLQKMFKVFRKASVEYWKS